MANRRCKIYLFAGPYSSLSRIHEVEFVCILAQTLELRRRASSGTRDRCSRRRAEVAVEPIAPADRTHGPQQMVLALFGNRVQTHLRQCAVVFVCMEATYVTKTPPWHYGGSPGDYWLVRIKTMRSHH